MELAHKDGDVDLDSLEMLLNWNSGCLDAFVWDLKEGKISFESP